MNHGGQKSNVCPTCGRPFEVSGSVPIRSVGDYVSTEKKAWILGTAAVIILLVLLVAVMQGYRILHWETEQDLAGEPGFGEVQTPVDPETQRYLEEGFQEMRRGQVSETAVTDTTDTGSTTARGAR